MFANSAALAMNGFCMHECVRELCVRARAWILRTIAEMRPDMSDAGCEIVALFIWASKEGVTIFGVHENRSRNACPKLETRKTGYFEAGQPDGG